MLQMRFINCQARRARILWTLASVYTCTYTLVMKLLLLFLHLKFLKFIY